MATVQRPPDVESLFAKFRVRGVTKVFVKHLSRNDNDKNQIYLCPTLDGIAKALGVAQFEGTASESLTKRRSSSGKQKVIAPLDWTWITADGDEAAPNTRLIHYFQYPEVRLSGFLSDCENPPDALRRTRRDLYGPRLLFFGSSGPQVFGAVLTWEVGSPDPVIPEEEPSGLSEKLLVVHLHTKRSTEEMIKALLGKWHSAVRLRKAGEKPLPFTGPQRAGYTLEALLGIPTNAVAGPDHQGSELKAYKSGGKVTLMTPVADGGRVHELGARAFVEDYGRPGKDGVSTRFTGTYKANTETLGRTLCLNGVNNHVLETISVDLQEVASEKVLASWSFGRLAASWLKKHDSAFYVAYETHPTENLVRFVSFYHCHHTSPERLLQSIQIGETFYDPAHTIKEGKLKVRPQWRINSSLKAFELTLRTLYLSVEFYAPS